MPSGYSRSPLLLKGALIEFSERFIGPIPNIIIFQYNPESLTRRLEVWQPSDQEAQEEKKNPSVPSASPPNAQPLDPPESFSLELELDATDDMEIGDPVAIVTGVADRLAALEMLLYPQEESLLGGLLGSLTASVSVSAGGISAGGGGAVSAEADKVPRGTVPVLMFVWGPGRIVPVRVTSFQVEEQAFSPILYPIRAKVTLEMKILTSADFPNPQTFSEELAVAAFNFTRTQKKVLAAANLANSVQSILGMLPF